MNLNSNGSGSAEMATATAAAAEDAPDSGELMNQHQQAQAAEQRYLLRWHRHAPTIADHLPNIYENGLFADVTIAVDGHSIKAHRLILASCSSYFLQMFQEADRNNIEHPYIVILNANLEDIRAILNFIYKGECCVYKHRIPELLATAKNLRVSGLSDMQFDDYLLLQPKQTPAQTGNVKQELQSTAIESAAIAAHKQQFIHTFQWQKAHAHTHANNRDVPETCKCFVCGKYLSNQYNLRVHMETHDETYHACTSCPHVSRSRDALRKHMSYRHPDKYNARKHKRTN